MYIPSTLGTPMRICRRFAMVFFLAMFQRGACGRSPLDRIFQTSRPAKSIRFGFALRAASIPVWISFMAPRSSTVPFSQVAMISLRVPLPSEAPSSEDVSISINVRRQLFLQNLQRVSSPTVVLYRIFLTASNPINVVLRPCCPPTRNL